jgi:hypothetical protein
MFICTPNWIFISNDDDFIGASIGGLGYNHRSYKKTIPKWKFIKGQFQTGIFKKSFFTSFSVSKCPYGS